MRTTIDLPDDLFRRAKATAALKGIKLKDLLTIFVEKGLEKQNEGFGHSEPIPVAVPFAGREMSAMTNAEIFEFLDREADQPHG